MSFRPSNASGTAEFARRVLPRPKRSSQPSSHCCSTPGHASAAACSRLRMSTVRTGAAVSGLDRHHVVGRDLDHVTAFASAPAASGPTSSRCPITSVSGGTEPCGQPVAQADPGADRGQLGHVSGRTGRGPRRASSSGPARPSRATSPPAWRCARACRPACRGRGSRPGDRSRAAASARTARCPRA